MDIFDLLNVFCGMCIGSVFVYPIAADVRYIIRQCRRDRDD